MNECSPNQSTVRLENDSSWVLQRILMVQVIWKAEAGESTDPGSRAMVYYVIYADVHTMFGILKLTSQKWGTMGLYILIRVGRCLGTATPAWIMWPDIVIKKKDKAVAIVIVDVRCASLCNLVMHNCVLTTQLMWLAIAFMLSS